MRNLPYWVKGGIIGVIISVILFSLVYFQIYFKIYDFLNFLVIPIVVVFLMISIILPSSFGCPSFLYDGPPPSNYCVWVEPLFVFLVFSALGFLVGSGFGYIFSKMKEASTDI
jgi:hypothetical protein